MRIIFLTFVAIVPLHASDPQKLALQMAADADFAHVVAATAPAFAIANQCSQSEAMLAAIAAPEEVPAITFRKGYCELAAAAATRDRASFDKAAETFDDAIADAESGAAKQKIPVKVSPAWRVLAAVARLNAGATEESQERDLAAAVLSADASYDCPADSAEWCRFAVRLGDAWLGRDALNRGELQTAERNFATAGAPAWSDWTQGRLAFQKRDYGHAAAYYARAIGTWRANVQTSFERNLQPRPVMTEMLADWAGAQIATGDMAGAVVNLDAAIRADGSNARAYYLRAIARERLGLNDAASQDFDSAARAALAKGGAAAAAEAHFYRGIVFYRRKEFVRAEDEFSSALNADVPGDWRNDDRAWRMMAAVAGGACGASREGLAREMASASPYFPQADARTAMSACPATSAANALSPRRFMLQFP